MLTSQLVNAEPEILNEETIPSYLISQKLFSTESSFQIFPITGGNVNFAYLIKEEPSQKNFFLKQAPEYVAIFGPDGFPLSSNRMNLEIEVYKEWKKILGVELYSKYLPEIIYFDNRNSVTIMEYFDEYTLLDHRLVKEGIVHNDVHKGLGAFIGKIHTSTHSLVVSQESQDYLKAHFENRPMRDLQLEFVFSKCYEEATNEQKEGFVFSDKYNFEIEQLKKLYNGNNKNNLVLSHGDLHPGSVMIKNEHVKIIDPEFTIYGPPGLDVGSLLSGYILAVIHQVFSGNIDAVKSICDGAETVWEYYKKALVDKCFSPTIIKNIEEETVGFAAAEVSRIALEFAGGRKWLQFDDQEVKSTAKGVALKMANRCMILRYRFGIALLFEEMRALLVGHL